MRGWVQIALGFFWHRWGKAATCSPCNFPPVRREENYEFPWVQVEPAVYTTVESTCHCHELLAISLWEVIRCSVCGYLSLPQLMVSKKRDGQARVVLVSVLWFWRQESDEEKHSGSLWSDSAICARITKNGGWDSSHRAKSANLADQTAGSFYKDAALSPDLENLSTI